MVLPDGTFLAAALRTYLGLYMSLLIQNEGVSPPGLGQALRAVGSKRSVGGRPETIRISSAEQLITQIHIPSHGFVGRRQAACLEWPAKLCASLIAWLVVLPSYFGWEGEKTCFFGAGVQQNLRSGNSAIRPFEVTELLLFSWKDVQDISRSFKALLVTAWRYWIFSSEVFGTQFSLMLDCCLANLRFRFNIYST